MVDQKKKYKEVDSSDVDDFLQTILNICQD